MMPEAIHPSQKHQNTQNATKLVTFVKRWDVALMLLNGKHKKNIEKVTCKQVSKTHQEEPTYVQIHVVHFPEPTASNK